MAGRVRVTVFAVRNDAEDNRAIGWGVESSDGVIDDYYETKTEAIKEAAKDCRRIAKRRGKAELIIKNVNGRIGKGSGSRRTYPKHSDPKRHKG